MGHRCSHKPSIVRCCVHSPTSPMLWGECEHPILQSRLGIRRHSMSPKHKWQIPDAQLRGEARRGGVGVAAVWAPWLEAVSFPNGHSKDSRPNAGSQSLQLFMTNGQPGDRGTPPSTAIDPGGQDTSLQPLRAPHPCTKASSATWRGDG